MFDRVDILSMPVDPVDMQEALLRCQSMLHNDATHMVITPNPEMVVALIREQFAAKAHRSTPLADAAARSSLSIPDGFGLVLADRFLGSRHNDVHLGGVVHGVDLMVELCRLAAEGGHRVLLIGGAEGVAERASDVLREQIEGLYILAARSSYDGTAQYDAELRKEMTEQNADVVFVAYGVGKQEQFMLRNYQHVPGVSIMMGVGGAFDFLAGSRSVKGGVQIGKTRRAPAWVRRLHMEWLYRLVMSPWRARRIWDALVVFSWWVLKYKLLMRPVYRANVAVALYRKTKSGVEILACCREDDHSHWQTVQGGIDAGESIKDAAVRELGEEIGLVDTSLFRIHRVLEEEHTYRWHFYARWVWGGRRHLGQRQRFVLIEYLGTEFEGIEWNGDHILEDGFYDCHWVPLDRFVKSVHQVRRDAARIMVRGIREYEQLR